MRMASPVKVIILAAGLGTRMRSRKAKVLHEAGGLPLVSHVVRAALAVAPASDICVVVGHQAGQVREHLAPLGVRFALQAEQHGTGHALLCAAPEVASDEGHAVVLYGDCPLLTADTVRSLVERQRAAITAATVITCELDDPTGYGRILLDEGGTVRAIVEQKAASPEQQAIREINSGIYCFTARLLWPGLAALSPNPASGEIYLTDLVEQLHGQGERVGRFLLTDPTEIMGINTRVELNEVDRLLYARKARALMLAGVTIYAPETVRIDAEVEVGMDTVIEPGVQLRGATRIGEDCHIGTGSLVSSSALANNVKLHPYTLVGSSRVGEGAAAGPFARLRQDNVVEAGAHIGNFVELKNVRFGSGSKASHLTYLGDATVGDDVNVGAGTITCNYDGVRKHRTEIGAHAFVGSNSTLVAPVRVEPESYVAAGSVITEAVPSGALALGRGRQVNKEGWVERKRQERQAQVK